jgi:tetratricopeptide (TPR) repeat protein
MKRRLWTVVLVCLTAGLIGTAALGVGRQTPQKPAATLTNGEFFPTEQLWIVKDIAATIGNIAEYANRTASGNPSTVRQVPRTNGELARFEITAPQVSSLPIRITDHIWSPASYEPLAAVMFGKGAACDPPSSSVVARLLEPTREVIQRENVRVSGRLRANMHCGDAHAEAALIVGTLALREAATVFNDPRRLISRMTAHLAIADASGVPADNEARRLSEIVLYTLVGRQRTALDRLATLDRTGSSEPLQSWIRALRMRNTGDWRIVSDANRATLLEQIELVRAAQYSLSESRVLDFIDAIKTRPEIPDWARIVMQENRNVEAGNRFSAEAVAFELIEAAGARRTYAPDAPDRREDLLAALKVEPTVGPIGPDGSVWVVDWPMWAAVAERHLMSTINARDTYLTYALSVPEEAKEFREQVARTFSGLRLYPFLAIHLATTKEEARPGMAGSLTLLQTRPELVTHWMWKTVLMKETWAGLPSRVPRLESWFTPPFPSGTVFDANTRPWDARRVAQFTVAEIAPYRQAAPYARSLPYATIGPKYDEAPAAVLKKEFGEMAEFNSSFAIRIADAQKDSPSAYLAAMEPVVRMNPDRLGDVAEYQVQHERLDDARQTFERWFATSRQELAVANSAEWMVRDYFDRGEFARASALADRAADTYSGGGLLTRAHLYDWRGDARHAEEYYRRVSERYNRSGDLLGFMLRHHQHGIEVDALKWKLFPAGVVSVPLPTLREAPLYGVEVAEVEKIGERSGIHLHDIIIAVDGIRVNNRAQYYAAKAMSLEPAMRLTIWRDLKYTEVTGPVRYGGLWGSVMDYEPGSRKAAPVQPRRW